MEDLFKKCDLTRIALAKKQGFYPYFQTLTEKSGASVVIDGKPTLMAGSNDYLGLSSDPRIQEAAIEAIRKWGSTCSGSRLLNGTISIHITLEERLAAFLGKEQALVVSTGYGTNLSAISALIGRNDAVVSDRLNHASLNDGIRLGWGTWHRYRHRDLDDAAAILAALDPSNGALLVTDGVFSMEGDMAELPGLVSLKQEFGCRLLVDDAHGLGVIGKNGRGTSEYWDVEQEVDLVTGTFSKSFASLGGVIAGASSVIEYIKHQAAPFIYTASMTPAAAAAALKALEIIEQEPERRVRLLQIAGRIRHELKRLGYQVYDGITPIIAIHIGSDQDTLLFWKSMLQAGVFVNPVVSPAVPRGKQLIRLFLMATLTDEEVEKILTSCEQAGKVTGILNKG